VKARCNSLAFLERDITACRACPRLVAWRERVAREKRAAYRDWSYWGRPVPGFGDPRARLLIVGLAPGAHGANRTGRMFTGDGSGDFLYGALHRAGLASQARSTSRDDGLRLSGAFVTAACRCAPPENRPSPAELARCAPFLDRELEALAEVRVVLALGAVAWKAMLASFARRGASVPRPRPRFAHGAELVLAGAPLLLGSYHVSRQNTQTGRLTPHMFDAVLARAMATGIDSSPKGGPGSATSRIENLPDLRRQGLE
jgi:uracil-DNA glycosylase family 4